MNIEEKFPDQLLISFYPNKFHLLYYFYRIFMILLMKIL